MYPYLTEYLIFSKENPTILQVYKNYRFLWEESYSAPVFSISFLLITWHNFHSGFCLLCLFYPILYFYIYLLFLASPCFLFLTFLYTPTVILVKTDCQVNSPPSFYSWFYCQVTQRSPTAGVLVVSILTSVNKIIHVTKQKFNSEIKWNYW